MACDQAIIQIEVPAAVINPHIDQPCQSRQQLEHNGFLARPSDRPSCRSRWSINLTIKTKKISIMFW